MRRSAATPGQRCKFSKVIALVYLLCPEIFTTQSQYLCKKTQTTERESTFGNARPLANFSSHTYILTSLIARSTSSVSRTRVSAACSVFLRARAIATPTKYWTGTRTSITPRPGSAADLAVPEILKSQYPEYIYYLLQNSLWSALLKTHARQVLARFP